MKRRIVCIVLFTSFFFILCLSIVWTSTAQTDTSQISIGVKVGDEFTYSSQLSLVPGSSSESANDFYLQYSSLEWFKLTITNIENTRLVNYSMVYHFSDGTELTSGWFSGGTYLDGSGSDFLVFPSNLVAGDVLYPFPANDDARSYAISETVPVLYSDGSRMTNHVQVANFGHHLPKGDLYFDQDTGMLAQYNFLIPQSTDSTAAALSWSIKLTGSNVWSVGSAPSITPSSTLAPSSIQPTLPPTPTPSISPTPSIAPTPTASQSIASNSWLNPTVLTAIVSVIVIVAVASILFVYLKRHIRIVRV